MALDFFGFGLALSVVILIVSLWSAFWKILGLWFSAKNGDKGWFVLFFLVSLLGILEIYYLHSEKDWPFG